MDLIKAVGDRRSIRSFRSEPVPKRVLEEILEICRWAPSSRNTQPWEVAVLGGKVMEEFKARITEKVVARAEPNQDTPAAELSGLYLKRAIENRDRIDCYQFPPGTESLEEKRAEYWMSGGRFFDAPNGIILYIDKTLYPAALLDIGIMIQAICLVAFAHGLATCPIRRVVYWPDILRNLLAIPQSKKIVLGIAIGYRNPEARVNDYIRKREPLESWVHWHGF